MTLSRKIEFGAEDFKKFETHDIRVAVALESLPLPAQATLRAAFAEELRAHLRSAVEDFQDTPLCDRLSQLVEKIAEQISRDPLFFMCLSVHDHVREVMFEHAPQERDKEDADVLLLGQAAVAQRLERFRNSLEAEAERDIARLQRLIEENSAGIERMTERLKDFGDMSSEARRTEYAQLKTDKERAERTNRADAEKSLQKKTQRNLLQSVSLKNILTVEGDIEQELVHWIKMTAAFLGSRYADVPQTDPHRALQECSHVALQLVQKLELVQAVQENTEVSASSESKKHLYQIAAIMAVIALATGAALYRVHKNLEKTLPSAADKNNGDDGGPKMIKAQITMAPDDAKSFVITKRVLDYLAENPIRVKARLVHDAALSEPTITFDIEGSPALSEYEPLEYAVIGYRISRETFPQLIDPALIFGDLPFEDIYVQNLKKIPLSKFRQARLENRPLRARIVYRTSGKKPSDSFISGGVELELDHELEAQLK